MNDNTRQIDVKCPYCGHLNRINAEVSPFVVSDSFCCDVANGGCDRLIIIAVSWHYIYEVDAYKYGENERKL